ncbi:hypothetical protein LCM08_13040 [Salipiger pacificus]|nr:hypothetical protein [Alloyangia pacifica]
MNEIMDWGGIAFGAAAAVFWVVAAFARVPKLSVPYGGVFAEDDPWVTATKRVTRLSRLASATTALAVGCQTIAAFIEKLPS